MRRVVTILASIVLSLSLAAQTSENVVSFLSNQLELQAEKPEEVQEDDTYVEQLAYLSSHPLNLNEADEDDLKSLLLLNDLQISSLISYRKLLGKLISIYELQAVPAWDDEIIRKLLPFVTVSESTGTLQSMRERYSGGAHTLLIRTSRVLEQSSGYRVRADSSTAFQGSPASLYIRYKYNYKNLLQWGFLGEKDAGEQLFRGTQPKGFDFYAFHVFLRKAGIIKALALGDFTVNMGQGLIQWQTLAFKKSMSVTSIKRQAQVLQPYSGAGEFNFHRGAGITLQQGKWEATGFYSARRISGNTVTDPLDHTMQLSSLLMSGYHRTASELENRNNVRQVAAGATVRYDAGTWHIAANTVAFDFSLPIHKEATPYNLYALSGRSFINSSIDYSFTYKNMHVFGEYAMDKSRNTALIQALVLSADPKVDLSLVCRMLDKSYQPLYANAFTENTNPSNEKGLYAGIALRPSASVAVSAYADVYAFPWLTYQADAPAGGKEYFIQLTYTPGKRASIYTQFRNELRQINHAVAGIPGKVLQQVPKRNWRLQYNLAVDPVLSLRNRCEMVWYDTGETRQQGFLAFVDLLYKPLLHPFSGNVRLMYFETEGYDARMYAFENDVMYAYSLPVFYDKGARFYLNVNYDFTRFSCKYISRLSKTEAWIRFANTVYPGKETIGSGNDQIAGDNKMEVKLQLMVTW